MPIGKYHHSLQVLRPSAGRYRVVGANEIHVGVVPEDDSFPPSLNDCWPVFYSKVKWLDEENGYRGCTKGAILEYQRSLYPDDPYSMEDGRWVEIDVGAEQRKAEALAAGPVVWYVPPPVNEVC